MRRREVIAGICGVITLPLVTRAQQTSVPVIGYLSSGSPESDAFRVTGLERGLNEAGYIVGRNVSIEYRWARNQFDQLPALAADLVQHRVAVIVAPGPFSTLAAKAATPTIPIVFTLGSDPVQLGLVSSLNRPGGNLTGVNVIVGEMAAKWLEVLHELLPTIASISFLENRRSPITEFRTRDVLAAARTMGIEIQIFYAGTEGEIETAFVSLVGAAGARAGALMVSNDVFFNNCIAQLVALPARYAIPTIYAIREFPLAGGLISYGINLGDAYRLNGLHVARILKGEKSADLPVIQPTKVELVINLKTAKTLGLTIPPSLLARADEVIE